VAHWKPYKGPATTPLWGYNLDTWWYEGQS
jgi:hypothetical protein